MDPDPRDGEADGIKGDATTGASSEPGVDAPLRNRGETLGRLEGKTDSSHASLARKVDASRREQRSEFRWLVGIGLGAFVTIVAAVIGAPHVLPPPSSAVPQHSPGGDTLTVNPSPAPSAAQTPAASN